MANRVSAVLIGMYGVVSLVGCAARGRPNSTAVLEAKVDELQQQASTSAETTKALAEQLSRIEAEVKNSNANTAEGLAVTKAVADAASDQTLALQGTIDNISKRLDRVEDLLTGIQISIQTKKEPTQVGSPCRASEAGPVTTQTREELERSEILDRLRTARVLPQGAECRQNLAVEIRCDDIPGTVVVVPAMQQDCCVDGYAVYGFDRSRRGLGFFLSYGDPNRIVLRDERNEGLDITYDGRGIQKSAAVGSAWSCIGESLGNRVDVKAIFTGLVNAALCAGGGVTLVACTPLLIEVGAVVFAVGYDCL